NPGKKETRKSSSRLGSGFPGFRSSWVPQKKKSASPRRPQRLGGSLLRLGRVLRHGAREAVEEALRLVRARRGLGVELDRGARQLAVADPLERAVEEALVRREERRAVEVRRVDREAVVVRCDEDAARLRVADGVVAAAMPELELARRGAEREAEDLVAEADAEERELPEEL